MLPSKFLRSIAYRFGLVSLLPATLAVTLLTVSTHPKTVEAQPAGAARAMTLRADIQEANAKTGVVTARGNVQINYPARQIQATAAQAQYFSKERRIVLMGNVYVLQEGNSLRGEVITYLIDEGRFVAVPEANKQVEATYLVIDQNPTPESPATPGPPPFETEPSGATSPNSTQR